MIYMLLQSVFKNKAQSKKLKQNHRHLYADKWLRELHMHNYTLLLSPKPKWPPFLICAFRVLTPVSFLHTQMQ